LRAGRWLRRRGQLRRLKPLKLENGMRLFYFSLMLAVFAFPAFAGEPADIVKYFYENPDEALKADNAKLGEPILTVLKANAANEEEPCIDFSPVMDAQDWDDKEIKDSLKLDERLDGDTASVAATFKLFGEERTVDWALAKQADGWKVVEISSKVGEWALSKIECQ
jgi:Protein of unknown function (DUF3828)